MSDSKHNRCERCRKLEKALANLRQEMNQKPDFHCQTIDYLIGLSETLTRAAEMLLEMRAKSESKETDREALTTGDGE